MHRVARSAVTLLLLAACPKPDSGGTEAGSTADGTTGGETLDTTGGLSSTTAPVIGEPCDDLAPPSGEPASPDLAPECACVDPLDGWVTCESPICPDMRGRCYSVGDVHQGCAGEVTWTYDEVALTCALEAARDGKEGTIRWNFGDGFSRRAGYLHILPGRKLIRQDREVFDLFGMVHDTDLWQLRDPQHFEGCLALASPCERMHCLFAGTTGPALSRCAPSYMFNP